MGSKSLKGQTVSEFVLSGYKMEEELYNKEFREECYRIVLENLPIICHPRNRFNFLNKKQKPIVRDRKFWNNYEKKMEQI